MRPGVGERNNKVRVAHDLSDLPEDESAGLILTLQDQPIIGGSDQTILENQKLAADYKRDFHHNIQEKLRGAHDPHDDFFRGRILAKYDEHNPEKEGFELDESGNLVNDSNVAASNLPKEGLYDMSVRKEVASDYYTEADLKPSSAGFKKRSKKSKDSQFGTGLGSKANRDFSFLRMADEEDNTDTEMLGKRKNIPQDNSEIDVGMKAKKEFYDNAMKRATEKVKSKSNFADAETQEQEDMYLLQQMMRNNKKLADLKAKQATDRLSELLHKKEIHLENDDLVSLDKMESDKSKHADLANIAKKAQMDLDPFKVPERRKKLNLAHQASGIASVLDISMPSERFRDRESNLESHSLQLPKVLDSSNQDKPATEMVEGNKEDNRLDHHVGLLEDDGPDLSRSTFAALEHMKKKGYFTKGLNNVYAGRKNDQKLHTRDEKVEAETESDGLVLEYRDKKGRLMNRKEAFRHICWGFHNKMPSKLKRAKMEKKIKSEQAAMFHDPSKSVTNRMLQEAQKLTNKPYLDLSHLGKQVGGGQK